MSSGINRLTELKTLQGIGRNILARFLESFQQEFTARNIPLLDPDLPDDPFFIAVAALFALVTTDPNRYLESACPPLNEALHAIHHTADPAKAQAMQTGLAQAGVPVELDPSRSSEHHAVLLWLAARSLLDNHLKGTITFDQLSTRGAEPLEALGVQSISKVTLRRIAIDSENAFHEINVRQADDLLACLAQNGSSDNPIPFSFYWT